MPNPRSTASINGHPLHPLLVPFPIALLTATLVADLVFWWTGMEGWATAAMWLLGFGILGAAVAAVAGITDFAGDAAIRGMNDAWQHFIGNVIAVAVAIVNFLIRLGAGAVEGVLPWGVWLSLITFAILLFTGWKGGEMVFHHRVGVEEGSD